MLEPSRGARRCPGGRRPTVCPYADGVPACSRTERDVEDGAPERGHCRRDVAVENHDDADTDDEAARKAGSEIGAQQPVGGGPRQHRVDRTKSGRADDTGQGEQEGFCVHGCPPTQRLRRVRCEWPPSRDDAGHGRSRTTTAATTSGIIVSPSARSGRGASFTDVIGGRNVVADITRYPRGADHSPRAARDSGTRVQRRSLPRPGEGAGVTRGRRLPRQLPRPRAGHAPPTQQPQAQASRTSDRVRRGTT
jgi:hypothetical protein